MIMRLAENLSFRKIKKIFERAVRAKRAGKKKKAIKEFNRAINLYLKGLRHYANNNRKK